MVTRETLIVLENELTFTKHVDRQFDDQFAKTGAKIGNVLNIRKPVRFTPTSGQGLQLQDLTETTVPLVLTTQYQRAFAVTSADLALNIDDFSKRFVKKAIISLANQIDYDGLGQFINCANEVGTPGTPPTTVDTYLAAGQRLNENAAPMGDRFIVMSPQQNRSIVGALTGLFNPQVTISKQYEKGMMTKDTLGFDWYMDQNTRIQTVGPLGGTPLVNGANQTGSSIITNGWTAAVAVRLDQGDVVTFAGCYNVNPQNRQSTGVLAQFVVTAQTSSDGAGNLTIPISPSIITTGAYQNCSASPTTGGAVTVQGAANTSTQRGLAFHEDAFTFACADLPLYGGLDMGDRQTDDQLRMSMRVIRDYDINTDRAPLRIDLLGGWATLYQELAVRVCQ
jgi:hypothetical protein